MLERFYFINVKFENLKKNETARREQLERHYESSDSLSEEPSR